MHISPSLNRPCLSACVGAQSDAGSPLCRATTVSVPRNRPSRAIRTGMWQREAIRLPCKRGHVRCCTALPCPVPSLLPLTHSRSASLLGRLSSPRQVADARRIESRTEPQTDPQTERQHSLSSKSAGQCNSSHLRPAGSAAALRSQGTLPRHASGLVSWQAKPSARKVRPFPEQRRIRPLTSAGQAAVRHRPWGGSLLATRSSRPVSLISRLGTDSKF